MNIYTEADAKKAVKVLFFEGAGCAERGDMENCRIRTAFRNDEGKAFYLEISGFEVTKHSPARYKGYRNAGHIDYCYELCANGKYPGSVDEHIRVDIERCDLEYSRANILDFVNKTFGCSFTDLVVTDMFYGYRVHGKGHSYNFMEEHDWNVEKAHAARMAYFAIDKEIREKMGERYSQISLSEIGTDTITVRCYASEMKMLAAGLDPNNRFITVSL